MGVMRRCAQGRNALTGSYCTTQWVALITALIGPALLIAYLNQIFSTGVHQMLEPTAPRQP